MGSPTEVPTEVYKGKRLYIATNIQGGMSEPHVDLFRCKPLRTYSCVLRERFDSSEKRWVNTIKIFDAFPYDDALDRGKEIAMRRNLPLLVEPYEPQIGEDLGLVREVEWHPKRWKPSISERWKPSTSFVSETRH